MHESIVYMSGIVLLGIQNLGFGSNIQKGSAETPQIMHLVAKQQAEQSINMDDTDNAIYFGGFIRQAYNGQPPSGTQYRVKACVNEGDTLVQITTINGKFLMGASNFTYPVLAGDTLHILAKSESNPDYQIYYYWILREEMNRMPPACLDNPNNPNLAITLSIHEVVDTTASINPSQLYAVYQVEGSAIACTVTVDTVNLGIIKYYDTWCSLEGQDPEFGLGRSVDITLYRMLGGDSIAVFDTTFLSDSTNTFEGVMVGQDTVWFPEYIGPIGISDYSYTESKIPFMIFPTVIRDYLTVTGVDGIVIYNALGQLMDSYGITGSSVLDLSRYSDGVYFVKPFQFGSLPVKIIKTW
ncbi:MAG: T9SS type A sorting domain-containing protein [candidate division WOR-3 bacterium]|nr:T9SS type A sorting domain-containing protein [candidate division WOR-3 bacterium]